MNKAAVDMHTVPGNSLKYRLLLGVVLLSSAIIAISSLPHRSIFIDDHWFAEQAYWLAHGGVVRSELFRGLLDYQVQQFAYLKLHIWQAAFLIKHFGLSAYTLKSIELVFFLACIYVLFIYFKKFQPARNVNAIFLICLTILLSNGTLVETAFNYRPEPALMLFGFISFLLLRISLHETENTLIYAVFSGISAGIAVLYHLNGLVFIVAGFFLFISENKFKPALIFSLSSLIVSSIYFIDIFSAKAFPEFIYQFKHDPAIHFTKYGIWQYPLNVLQEFPHIFRHPKEGSFSLLAIILIISNWKVIKANREIFYVFKYFLVTFFVLAAISPGKRDPNYYLLIYIPYLAIILGYCLYHLPVRSRLYNSLIMLLAVLFLVTNYAYIIQVTDNRKPTPKTNRLMISALHIEDGESIAGPVSLVFDEIEHLRLYATRTYFIKVQEGIYKLSASSFFKDMQNNGIDYIILSAAYKNKLGLENPDSTKSRYGYTFYRKYIDVDRSYFVFKRSHLTQKTSHS